MKNQYVGDIGDFGKYSLLKAFSDAEVKIGVNWYLTKNDDSNDGKHINYLKKGDLRWLSPEIFDELERIAFSADKSVSDIKECDILPGTLFYSELLAPEGKPAERKTQREKWFQRSLDVLVGADLIFMDPDNGLLVDGFRSGWDRYVSEEFIDR